MGGVPPSCIYVETPCRTSTGYDTAIVAVMRYAAGCLPLNP